MLLLISGPSGAGKSTFVKALLANDARLEFSVSTTTRPRRGGESDGIQYHFVTEDEFDRLIAADAFVEWARVHDHRYGTRNEHLQQIQGRGMIPLLDLDVQGGAKVMEIFGRDIVSVFIFPPSWQELQKRLRGRGTDTEAVIQTRLANARWEVGFAAQYEYFIVNDDLQEGLRRIQAIITAEGCRRIRMDKMPLQGDF
jgi:guanylate kinase